jgi:hypothetical protein
MKWEVGMYILVLILGACVCLTALVLLFSHSDPIVVTKEVVEVVREVRVPGETVVVEVVREILVDRGPTPGTSCLTILWNAEVLGIDPDGNQGVFSLNRPALLCGEGMHVILAGEASGPVLGPIPDADWGEVDGLPEGNIYISQKGRMN